MYLFIVTHLGSGASALCDALSRHPRCGRAIRQVYSHANDLAKMKEGNPFSKIYFDKLVYNYQFTCPSLYSQCKFIYVIREPKLVLPYLVHVKGYSARGACRYYAYRLRRLCEMARKTPNKLVSTFDEIDVEKIRKFINVKQSINLSIVENKEVGEHPYLLREFCQERYESYFNLFFP